ncbi:MAG: arsenite methyltransferase [Fibrobacterales bacterium]
MTQIKNDQIRKSVRETYGKIALSDATVTSCCAPSCCDDSGSSAKATSMELGYSSSDVNEVPEGANMGLGCGNPKAIASLQKGETVLDLGSGGGFDAFLAVQEVGKAGSVIGVDMTSEMVSKARANADKLGHSNVDFRLGEIEHLPVADSVVDVIISNCVINLSPEKLQVFKEAYRVLKPGGRLAISDVVATAKMPEKVKGDMALYTGCIAGASPISDIEAMLKDAGFENISIKPKDESREFIRNWVPEGAMEDYVVSATIEAVKPYLL